MSSDNYASGHDGPKRKNSRAGGVSGGVYGLAFMGALVYYIQHASTFWMGLLGFLKALIWPAFLIYKVMEFLKM